MVTNLDVQKVFKQIFGENDFDKFNSFLDIGCGRYNIDPSINHEWWVFFNNIKEKTGIDFSIEELTSKKKNYPNANFIWGDALDEIKKLDKNFDLVMCHQMIEHISKEKGIELVKEIIRVSKKAIFITTPFEWNDNENAVRIHNNSLEKHQCLWTVNDFEKLGLKTCLTRCEKVICAWILKEKQIK